MTAIVPLTTYKTLAYKVNNIPNLKINTLGTSIIKIGKTNFVAFKEFMKTQSY